MGDDIPPAHVHKDEVLERAEEDLSEDEYGKCILYCTRSAKLS